MRVFPRFRRPNFKLLSQRLLRLRRYLSGMRLVFMVEWLIFGGILFLALTTGQAALKTGFAERADVLALALGLLSCVVLHMVFKAYLLPRIRRYFSPVSYNERRILSDLGQEARKATDLDHLFRLIVGQIGEVLQAEDVSIFVRDETTRNYVLRVSSSQATAQQVSADLQASETPARDALTLGQESFVVSRLRSLTLPLEIGPQDFEAWERFLAFAEPMQRAARQKEQEVLTQIKTRLLMPIRSKDQLVGFMSLGPCRVRHEYDAADKDMLMSVGSQLALVIENSHLTERLLVGERLRRELALAAEVQRRLLPAHAPVNLSVDLAGFCQPARGVGGDYYDFIEIEHQQLGIALADVAGKGISAALLMSTVQATLRSLLSGQIAHRQGDDSLAHMVTTLNRLLHHLTGGKSYVTFFFAYFNEHTKQLTYVNAGHNPPILLRNGRADDFTQLSTGGTVVGLFEDCLYEQEVVQMQEGDLLMVFTDGLSEALNVKGEEFGEARIEETLTTCQTQTANEIHNEIISRVQAWCIGAEQHDDLTFVAMKVK
jgi:sigma-B regulation protein RsbU (phosphoserine phosphatase)